MTKNQFKSKLDSNASKWNRYILIRLNSILILYISKSFQFMAKKKYIVWLSTSNRPWFWNLKKGFFFSILLYKRIPTLLLEIPEFF